MSKLLDIVDEADNIIGQETRTKIHEAGTPEWRSQHHRLAYYALI